MEKQRINPLGEAKSHHHPHLILGAASLILVLTVLVVCKQLHKEADEQPQLLAVPPAEVLHCYFSN